MGHKEECFECEKECQNKYVGEENNGYVIFCSLECAEKYIKKNWRNFVFSDEE
jgi:hypothetical protein